MVSVGYAVYYDDGQGHVLDSDLSVDSIYLDYYVANDPGTHLDILSTGTATGINAYQKSTVEMSGGSIGQLFGYDQSGITVSGGSVGIKAWFLDSSTFNMNGGSLLMGMVAYLDSSFSMTGGEILNDPMQAFQNSIGTVSGGFVEEGYEVYDNAMLYLEGSGFEVNGTPLGQGDKLSDYGTFVENGNTDYYTGTITGTLADGSALNNSFSIYNTGSYAGTADIVIVPEPGTLALLGLGGTTILRRRLKIKSV